MGGPNTYSVHHESTVPVRREKRTKKIHIGHPAGHNQPEDPSPQDVVRPTWHNGPPVGLFERCEKTEARLHLL